MAGPLKPLSQHDFSGGVNAVVNPFDAGPKQCLRITNFVMDEHGSLRVVDGTKILTTAPLTEAGNRLLMAISWKPVGGTLQRLVISQPLAAVASKLYSWSTTPWTLIGTFVGNSNTPGVAILNNLMVFTDGYNTPRSWDGAAFVPLAGYPAGVGGRHIIHHEGFLYLWNTASVTTATDGPSALRQSDLNNPNSWNAAQIVFIGKDDGTEGRGVASYTIAESGVAPEDTLILFKDKSAYQMKGNMGTGGGAPSTNFSLQRIKTDMGCYAPSTIQFVAGFGVIRLTHRGFALYDGTEDRLISEEIRPYLFGRDDITAMDWVNAGYSWAAQSQNPPIYIAFCPTSGTSISRAFLYDLVRRAWTVVDLPFNIASVSLIAETNALPIVVLGDAPTATTPPSLRRWFAQDPDWDGTPITWFLRSQVVYDGSPLHPLYFRSILWDILAESAGQFTYQTVYSTGQIKGPYSQSLAASNPANIITADLDVTARNAYYELCGTGRIRLRAHDWFVRKKPLRGTNI